MTFRDLFACPSSIGRGLIAGGLAVSIGMGLPSPAQGQARSVIRGVVKDHESGAPIAGAVVRLVVDPPDTGASALTRQDGGFVLPVPAVGEWPVEVIRLGYRDWVSEPLASDHDRIHELRVPVEPVVVEQVEVAVAARCSGKPDAIQRAWTLLTDVREDLRQIAARDESDTLAYRLAVYEELQIDTRRFEDLPQDSFTVISPVPLSSPSPRDLATAGYVQVDHNGVSRYYAPSARTLASEEFVNTHCFEYLERDGSGLDGVRFWPMSEGDAPDILGVLWIDPSRTIVDRVEFTYTGLREFLETHDVAWMREERFGEASRVSVQPLLLDDKEFGGVVRFARLSDGSGVTELWKLRFPIIWSYDVFDTSGAHIQPRTNRKERTVRVLRLLRIGGN